MSSFNIDATLNKLLKWQYLSVATFLLVVLDTVLLLVR